MAELGVKAVRYPILWETVAPETPGRARLSAGTTSGWSVSAKHGIKVIAGLVHHGSGPALHQPARSTSFADHLAHYAERVAAPLSVDRDMDAGQRAVHDGALRLPLRPLVSARQGHRRDVPARLSTSAWRRSGRCARSARSYPTRSCSPTEDIGRTFSTQRARLPGRARQRAALADLRSARSAASCEGHQFYRWLRNKAATQEVLDELATGEGPTGHHRFRPLSHQRSLPRSSRRSAIRASKRARTDATPMSMSRPFASTSSPRLSARQHRLRETWERYGTPIAITEVHHGCTRDEQVRWLHEVWTAAEQRTRSAAPTFAASRSGRCSA